MRYTCLMNKPTPKAAPAADAARIAKMTFPPPGAGFKTAAKPAEAPDSLLRMAAYYNNGNSAQVLVLPSSEGYLRFSASTSHGYASLPKVTVVTDLPALEKELRADVSEFLSYRDPAISFEGTGAFAKMAERLQRHTRAGAEQEI